MSWILSTAIGTCMVIVVGGVVIAAWMLLSGWMEGRDGKTRATPEGAVLEARIAELERRLTDTQDIVISLSEKLDRIDADKSATSREAV